MTLRPWELVAKSALVHWKVNEMRLAIDAETAGAIIRPTDDGRGPAILRGRDAPECAAGRTGENRIEHRLHGSP